MAAADGTKMKALFTLVLSLAVSTSIGLVLAVASCTTFSADDSDAASGSETSTSLDASVSMYAATVLEDEPIAYWRMNAATPTSNSIADTSGNGHVLTLTGAGHQRGLEGATSDGDTSIGFDGQSSTATASLDNSPLHDKVSFTIECWAAASSTDDASQFRNILGSTSSIGANRTGVLLYEVPATSRLVLEREIDGAATAGGGGTAATTLTRIDIFHHMVVTYDESTVTLWLDGVLAATAASTATVMNTDAPLVLGSDGVFPVNLFRGRIDEVAVYAKVLPQGRILAHFAAATQ